MKCTLLMLTLLTGLFALSACDSREESANSMPAMKESIIQQVDAVPRKAFTEPIEPVLYELPSSAVATWRKYSSIKPALLLFANHPLLQPLPGDDLETIKKLVRNGTDEELLRRSRFLTADTLFLPPQSVSVSVAAGIFSELVFVRPFKGEVDKVSLEEFRGKALAAGFVSEEEAKGLTLEDGVISGRAWGLPFRCVHPLRIPKLASSVILHIDLGYFNDLYVNEVKTPIYDTMYEVAMSLREAEVPTIAATFSYSNQEVGFSLDSRFVITELAEILRRPALLEGGTPESWTLRQQAIYKSTMFDESASRELFVKAAESNPEDAAAQYALAMSQFETGKSGEGFASLDRAVAIDPGYALQYLELYERAEELSRPDKAIEMLQKAAQAMPDNPFVRIRLVDLLLQRGRTVEARPLIAQLKTLPWSSAYHPGTVELLEQMGEAAKFDLPVPVDPPVAPDIQQRPAPRSAMPPHMGIPGH